MDAAEEILARYDQMKNERDGARERLAKLAAIILPALQRVEATERHRLGPVEVEARVTVLGAALRELAPLLTSDQRAEMVCILTEGGP